MNDSQSRGDDPTAPFLRACRGLPARHTPVWLMRQAGRYMREYRALREQYSMMDMINTPEVAAQVTLQPIDEFGFDAAIIFSDILPPLIGMGLGVEFVEGLGPRILRPVREPADVDRLSTPPPGEALAPTLEAIGLVAAELGPRGVPLIGFAGAPFTLASYAVEAGGSKSYTRVKSFMYAEPDAWGRLMDKLVDVLSEYLLAQVGAGAQSVQLFDSWAGLALGRDDYVRYVQPFNRKLFDRVAKAGVPVVNFSTGTACYLDDVAACGGDVVGVDWRMPLDWAWERVGLDRPIQGNLDPVALLAPWTELKPRIDDVLDRAAGRPGHIFNLGHGIFPETPIDNVRRLVDRVHERTAS